MREREGGGGMDESVIARMGHPRRGESPSSSRRAGARCESFLPHHERRPKSLQSFEWHLSSARSSQLDGIVDWENSLQWSENKEPKFTMGCIIYKDATLIVLFKIFLLSQGQRCDSDSSILPYHPDILLVNKPKRYPPPAPSSSA
jgi:hypothetical protein